MGDGAAAKAARVLAALEHREPDRAPIGEFFWADFIDRCRSEIDGSPDFDPYRYWDLDYVVLTPNLDPRILGVEVVAQSAERTIVRTGFGATIEHRPGTSMPAYVDFGVKSYEDLERYAFDDPADRRRYCGAIDDQMNAVVDRLVLGLPSFVDRLDAYADDFCVFGGVCEPYEMLWRVVGSEAALLMIGEDPARMARFAERLGDFLVGIVHGQAEAAKGRLTGIFVWGDVAYDRGMLFSPAYWRSSIKPQVRRICDAAHEHGLKVVYHGDGDDRAIYQDLIECGVDAKQPLEVKAGLDVVDLKGTYGDRLSFIGNIDARILASNDRDRIRREVLRKLEAARGGGYIIQSDHSVPGDVSPAAYSFFRQLVADYGWQAP